MCVCLCVGEGCPRCAERQKKTDGLLPAVDARERWVESDCGYGVSDYCLFVGKQNRVGRERIRPDAV